MKIKKQGDNFQKTQGEKKIMKERVFFSAKNRGNHFAKHEAHSFWGKAKLNFHKVFKNNFILVFFFILKLFFKKLCENHVLLFSQTCGSVSPEFQQKRAVSGCCRGADLVGFPKSGGESFVFHPVFDFHLQSF